MRSHPLSRAGAPLASSPGDLPSHPWRFYRGQAVYTPNQLSSTPFEVISGVLHHGFPHYILRDGNGQHWRIPQLHCSTKPPFPVRH